MFRKIFLTYLGLLLLALALILAFSIQSIRSGVRTEIARRLETSCRMLMGRAPGTLKWAGDERITVIAPDGKVLADSHGEASTMRNHNERPEVAAARAQGTGMATRYSDTVHYDMMYFAMIDRETGNVVRTALPLSTISAEVNALARNIGLVFLIVAAIGAAATFAVARWITRPLRQIRESAKSMAEGDFTRKAPLLKEAEMGELSQAMNWMAEELSHRMANLQEESARLQAVIAGMEEGVVAIDGSGTILLLNQAAATLLKVEGTPTGIKLTEALRIADVDASVAAVLREGKTVRTSVSVGSKVFALCFSPLSSGRGAVMVANDVTEENRYHALRKEFVANVSHELRTPLASIQGYVETLKDGAVEDPAAARDFLGTIEKNVERLSALVSDLLELSRLESTGQIVKPERVDVAAVLGKIRDTCAPLAQKKKQELVFDAVSETLEADPGMLERAVSNLVENAIKYTPEDGRIEVRGSLENEAVVISVRDNGIGIPEPALPRIFERFYRVDKSRSRDSGGTGLGLAIVKHIMQLHGGSVTVESKVGSGTTFRLRFPKSSATF